MRYKVGDKVVIVKNKVTGMNNSGEMNHWLGKTMTIKRITESQYLHYKMVEDSSDGFGDGWSWSDNMIDHEATAKLHKGKPMNQNEFENLKKQLANMQAKIEKYEEQQKIQYPVNKLLKFYIFVRN